MSVTKENHDSGFKRRVDADRCGKRVVKAHRAEAIEVEWPPSALTDLDVPEDFERVRTRFEGG